MEKDGDTLYLYESHNYGEMVLVPFPHHLFAGEEDKRAALVYKACSDAVAFMQHIAKLLLKGTYLEYL